MTRFDEDQTWEDGFGRTTLIKDLETSHMVNIIGMFIKKPTLVQSLLIKDLSRKRVWVNPKTKSLKTSIHNATSMNLVDLLDYFYESPLYKAIETELEKRGVNVEQVINNFLDENLKPITRGR